MTEAVDIRCKIHNEYLFYGSKKEAKDFIEKVKDITRRAAGREWESMRLRLLDYEFWKKLAKDV
jgi:hypothetical protein